MAMNGLPWSGDASPGGAGPGKTRRALRHGAIGLGQAQLCKAGQGKHPGGSWYGPAGPGMAKRGRQDERGKGAA